MLAVRYALAALKGVGAAAMRDLVAERDKNGLFKSIADFAQRLDNKMVNRRQLESLIKAGAFDSVDSNRAMLFHGVDVILGQANQTANERKSGQKNLFGGGEPQPLALAHASRLETDRTVAAGVRSGGFLSLRPSDGGL